MTYLWTRIVSWHLVPRGGWTTLCGRESTSRVQLDEYPSGERTCESCLRIAERRSHT